MRKILYLCLLFLSVGVIAQTTVTIGSGASTSGTSDNGCPIYRSSSTSSYNYSRSVHLLSISDLSAVSIGSVINSIAFYKTTAYNVSGTNAMTLKVYLKNSTATTLASGTSWSSMLSNATLFYDTTINASNNFPAAAGWVPFTSNTGNSFIYTGGALEVYIDWYPSGTVTSPYSGGAFQWKYDTVTTNQSMGTSSSTALATTGSSYTVTAKRYQTQINFTPVPCAGTPNPGNTISSAVPTCPGPYTTTLSLQNVSQGNVTYQWYRNGLAVSGAVYSTYTTSITAADSYYCAVTCAASGVTTNSTPITVAAPNGSISTYPLSENFDSSSIGSSTNNNAPSCWSYLETSGSAGYGYISSSSPYSPSLCYYLYNSSDTAGNIMLVSPSMVNLTDGTKRVRFIGKGNGNTVQIGTLSDPTNPASFTAIGSPVTLTSAWEQYSVVIPSGTGSYLAIKHGLGGTYKSIYIDDVVIENIPACGDATGLSISAATTPTTATISWTAPAVAPSNGYDLYYSTTNVPPTASTVPQIIGATSNPYTLQGLTPGTVHYVWVRSNCGSSVGAWTVYKTFTTMCLTVVPNYTFGFDSGTGICWDATSLGGTPSTGSTSTGSALWVSASYLNSGSDNAIKFNSYSTDRIAWLKSPLFNLSAGGYRVKFNYGLTDYADTTASNLGSDDVVQFLISQDGGATWSILQTWTASSVISNLGSLYSLDLTSYNSANTKFAFYASSGTVDDVEDVDFFVDNFTVESINLATSEVNVQKNNIKVYPNPFADVVNISDVSKVKSISVMDMSGKLVKTIDKPSATIHLGDLTSGMYMVVLNLNDGSKQTIKAIKK